MIYFLLHQRLQAIDNHLRRTNGRIWRRLKERCFVNPGSQKPSVTRAATQLLLVSLWSQLASLLCFSLLVPYPHLLLFGASFLHLLKLKTYPALPSCLLCDFYIQACTILWVYTFCLWHQTHKTVNIVWLWQIKCISGTRGCGRGGKQGRQLYHEVHSPSFQQTL